MSVCAGFFATASKYSFGAIWFHSVHRCVACASGTDFHALVTAPSAPFSSTCASDT